MAELYIYPKTGQPFTLALAQKRISLGRSPDNEVVLTDQFSSGRHAVIFPSAKSFVIQDQASKNGTFVNGKRIEFETELRKGDEILVGTTRIIFDKEFHSNVELVDRPPFAESSNTIVQVRDILKKPAVGIPARLPGPLPDAAKVERDRKFLEALSEVSQALIYHMPMDKLVDHIMDLITRTVSMDRGVLLLREGNPVQLIPRAVRVRIPSLESRSIQVSQSIINTVLADNSSVLVTNIQADEHFRNQASLVGANVHSALCVPLWNNQEIIGIVYADRASLSEPFSEDDLRLLTLLANLAAVKIENARLFEQALEKSRMERELDLAAQIQRNFLPKGNPSFEPFDICGANRSCEQVGGDYYDFIPIDENRLGIAVGDVSGKGVSASLLMASLRAALHAEIRPGYPLVALAAKLNDFVYGSSESNSFITFFFAELNRSSGEMAYVNAGHNPPLVLDTDGNLRRLESTGFCLGMFPGVSYETGTIRLGPGDIACLFTDGIPESRNRDKEEFGETRLASVLREASSSSADAIMDKIFQEVRTHSGCEGAADDMTIVVIKRKP